MIAPVLVAVAITPRGAVAASLRRLPGHNH
jgi:hypothetical protein